MKGLFGGPKKDESYKAASSDEANAQEPHAQQPQTQPGMLGEALAKQDEVIASLRLKLTQSDAVLAHTLVEHLTVLRTLQLELSESEAGVGTLSSRVSTLEANEKETTQLMGATFQKDAQQRLELKQAKARAKAQEQEIMELKHELADVKAACQSAQQRIRELEDGHLASIIDSDEVEEAMVDRASKHDITGVEYGSNANKATGAGSGGVNLNNTNGMCGRSSPVGLELDISDMNALDDEQVRSKTSPGNSGEVTKEAPGCCMIL